jgi:hypothetical protein
MPLAPIIRIRAAPGSFYLRCEVGIEITYRSSVVFSISFSISLGVSLYIRPCGPRERRGNQMILHGFCANSRLSYVFLPFLAFGVAMAGQAIQETPHTAKAAHAAPGGCTIDTAALSSLGEMVLELRRLRAELLGFYFVAKQEKTIDLERKVNELRAQRERLDVDERRAIQFLAELDAQFASATAEERERIQAEKASRGGPALEGLRTRQVSLSRQEDDLRGLLASEQQRLAQLKQLITETTAAR